MVVFKILSSFWKTKKFWWCTDNILHVPNIIHWGWSANQEVETNDLSKDANSSTSVGREDSSMRDILEKLVSYALVSVQPYGNRFADAVIKEVLEIMGSTGSFLLVLHLVMFPLSSWRSCYSGKMTFVVHWRAGRTLIELTKSWAYFFWLPCALWF